MNSLGSIESERNTGMADPGAVESTLAPTTRPEIN